MFKPLLTTDEMNKILEDQKINFKYEKGVYKIHDGSKEYTYRRNYYYTRLINCYSWELIERKDLKKNPN